MTYTNWLDIHSIKHKTITEQLKDKSIDEIIDYFDYENMKLKHPDFCPLYASNSKCHDMKKLNCFMCACPYFRFNDNGLKCKNDKMIFSYCIKGYGTEFASGDSIHQDCSDCILPHTKDFIKNNFDLKDNS